MLIVDPDTHPSRTIYFTAGLARRALEELAEADLATLYSHLREAHRALAMPTLVLALDLLFLLGLVEPTEGGAMRCS